MPKNGAARSYDSSIFNILKNVYSVFHSGWTNLHSHHSAQGHPLARCIHYMTDLSQNTFSSVQFSRSIVSESLWPHELQHAGAPCPSPTPGVHPNPCPFSWWCHPASVVPFSSCPQSLPESKSFPISQLLAWGGQSTGVSALASFLPKKSQGLSPSEWIL